jgi:hypothetical protein
MINKFTTLLFLLLLTSCVIKNYDTQLSEKPESGATIHWKDGSKTDIKPPVIENKP